MFCRFSVFFSGTIGNISQKWVKGVVVKIGFTFRLAMAKSGIKSIISLAKKNTDSSLIRHTLDNFKANVYNRFVVNTFHFFV